MCEFVSISDWFALFLLKIIRMLFVLPICFVTCSKLVFSFNSLCSCFTIFSFLLSRLILVCYLLAGLLVFFTSLDSLKHSSLFNCISNRCGCLSSFHRWFIAFVFFVYFFVQSHQHNVFVFIFRLSFFSCFFVRLTLKNIALLQMRSLSRTHSLTYSVSLSSSFNCFGERAHSRTHSRSNKVWLCQCGCVSLCLIVTCLILTHAPLAHAH